LDQLSEAILNVDTLVFQLILLLLADTTSTTAIIFVIHSFIT